MINRVICFLLLILSTNNLFSQEEMKLCNHPDGRSEWLIEYQSNPPITNRSDDIIWVNIQFHLVGDDDGIGHYDEYELRQIFCQLNEAYADANIQFYMEDNFNYINSSASYYYDPPEEAWEVHGDAESEFPDRISVFILKKLGTACGTGSIDGGTFLALVKRCFGVGTKVLPHEIGHIFSMPHTFWPIDSTQHNLPAPEGYEKADGSNCATAGDGFCDTRADYIGYRWDCNEDQESEFTLRDPDNVEFRADGRNFMSYSDDYCSDRFSGEQMEAMRAYVTSQLSHIINENYEQKIIAPINALTGIQPANGAEINTTDVTLQWDAIENVTHYVVELSKQSDFDSLTHKEVVTDNNIDLSNILDDGSTYYWRLGIYNLGYTCFSDYLDFNTFSTGGEVTSAQNINGEEFLFSIIPNPVQSGSKILIQLESELTQEVDISISNITGQISAQTVNMAKGQRDISIDVKDMSKGLYFVTLSSVNFNFTKKLIIN